MTENTEIKKTTILCAEDEAEIRENIAEILQDEGFDVIQAANGKEALDLFLKNKIDVVVSDIMMPEMSGYDLLKAIRQNDSISNSDVPFILLTALGQKDNVVKGIELMANDYLVKPIDFDLLIAKIKEKVGNASKVQKGFNKKIDNIRDKVSNMMPSEMGQYVDIISQIAKVLKDEPYGPFPHKKYIDDLNKIYIHSVKLRSVINNFISGEAISGNIASNDEVLDPVVLVEEFVARLNPKFRDKIKFGFENKDSLPKIKIEKASVVEAMKKIISAILRVDSEVELGYLTDHLNRLILVFNLTKPIDEASLGVNLNKEEINKILDPQGCSFDTVLKGSEATLLLYYPVHRVVARSA